ncbi:MAG: alpha-amylase family glycosyl hydrolase, partial [Haloarculaceae archaeon]
RFREASAKLLATLLFTLEGTPFVYQGDEIGMTNYPWDSLEEIEDVDTLRNVRVAREAGRFEDEAEMMALVRHRTRDNARTPMQWSDDPHAGFTDSDADPWLPVNPNYPEVNVEAARADPDSVWHHYRTLIDLRDEYDVLVYGEYADLEVGHERVWAYERTLGDERVVVVLAFAEEPVEVDPDAVGLPREGERLLGNYPPTGDPGTLRPYEARVYLD